MLMTDVRANERGKCKAGKCDLRDKYVVNRIPGWRTRLTAMETSDRLGGYSP